MAMKALEQCIHGRHDKEIDRAGNDKKRKQRVYELAVKKFAAVDRKRQSRKIGLLDDRSDERSEQILDETIHYSAKRSADHDAYGHIDYIPSQ